jgi:hypothetical protein
VGCLGQAGFMGPFVKPHLPVAIAVAIFGLPALIIFTITFFRQCLLPPRAFRFCVLFATCWFATLTVVAEIFLHLGYMPPESPKYALTELRSTMHVGWLFLIFVVHLFFGSEDLVA